MPVIHDPAHSPGHYHATIVDVEDPENEELDRNINEPDFDIFAHLLSRELLSCVRDVGFVCTWGCGQLHPLTAHERQKLRLAMGEGP